jgi:2-hydroxychromene-2-carboxylate isomerase
LRRIVFHFDVVSPFAFLAFEALPQALEGCNYQVDYCPVLLGALLRHWGQKGPAEVAPKRAWVLHQVQWLAARQQVEFAVPTPHPFSSVALQRLALAAAPAGEAGLRLGPNRRVVELLFQHVWQGGGADPNDPVRLAALVSALAPARDPQGDEVKQALRSLTDVAIAQGVFGVPSFELAGRVFWGLDALPMLRDALQGGPWFSGSAWPVRHVQAPYTPAQDSPA